MTAAKALQLDVHAHPGDLPLLGAAGVDLFQFYNVFYMQIYTRWKCCAAP